jgi:FkbM family methyltransferase
MDLSTGSCGGCENERGHEMQWIVAAVSPICFGGGTAGQGARVEVLPRDGWVELGSGSCVLGSPLIRRKHNIFMPMSSFRELSHHLVRLAGFDYLRYNPANFAALRRAQILRDLNIRLVLDVGAHDGGYGKEIRSHGYEGTIISFEPLSGPYERLARATAADGNWQARPTALGSASGVMPINVSGRLTSSSFLGMTPAHKSAAPESEYVGVETVGIERLDKILSLQQVETSAVWLKVDVQGYEEHVLEGSGQLLGRFAGVEVELSLTSVYEGAPLVEEVLTYLRQRGFRPVSFENVLIDPKSGHVLQLNGMFVQEFRGNTA